jgi:hypothetical protein
MALKRYKIKDEHIPEGSVSCCSKTWGLLHLNEAFLTDEIVEMLIAEGSPFFEEREELSQQKTISNQTTEPVVKPEISTNAKNQGNTPTDKTSINEVKDGPK